MSITKKTYYEDVKPIIDKIYDFLRAKNKNDEDGEVDEIDRSLITDMLLNIVQNETNLDEVSKIIDAAGPYQKQLCEKYGIQINLLGAKLKA